MPDSTTSRIAPSTPGAATARITQLRDRAVGAAGRLARQFPPSRTKSRAGRALAYALGDPASLEGEIDGKPFFLRPAGRTCGVGFWCGDFEPNTMRLLGDLVSEGSVILDIGANVGLIGLRLLDAVGPTGKLLLFEPVSSNCELIRQTIAARNVEDLAELFEVALAEEDDEAEIFLEGRHGQSANAMLAPPMHGDKPAIGMPIVMRQLDAILAERALTSNVDLIKIDVEGAEAGVFRGATDMLKASLPIVFGEFHPKLMPRYGTTFYDAYEVFEPLGYNVFVCAEPEDQRVLVRVRPEPGRSDLLLIPDAKLDDTVTRLTDRGWKISGL